MIFFEVSTKIKLRTDAYFSNSTKNMSYLTDRPLIQILGVCSVKTRFGCPESANHDRDCSL